MPDQEEAAERVEERVDEARGVYKRQNRIVRGLWIAVAVVLVLSGLAMFVFPGGPAWLVIPVGLGMLGAVFGWARRLLKRSVRKGVKAKNVAEDTNRKVKVLGVATSACLAAAAIVLIGFWVFPG